MTEEPLPGRGHRRRWPRTGRTGPHGDSGSERERTIRPAEVPQGKNSPFGFELVRRGYDRGQVDEAITRLVADRDTALDGIAALETLIEELQLASMDGGGDAGQAADVRRRAVATIAEARARAERVGTAATDRLGQRAGDPPFAFELVRRGYDRGQVDEAITGLVGDRDGSRARVARLAERIEELCASPQA
ncbi:hypothetical protein ACIRPT_12895 [Streptomyces sp. NPDC101227]|uniref:hypothetical protein n=1 Tax=Streptomyces sp. NPDC101227 TaxID=3366136 RepID=UPI00380ADCC2